MKLTILGGGGFRVPLVYGALLGDRGEPRIDEVVLYDIDAARLSVIAAVLAQQADGAAEAPTVRTTTELDDAIAGSDVVFSAVRVGGAEGRSHDEHVSLDLGLLGQETTGPAGLAYGWRTIPFALRVSEIVARTAPHAYVINFTNPAGMITEAMQSVLGDAVIGICDSPIGLARRASRALGLDPTRTFADYAGLNHLGWLRSLTYDGVDVLPRLLADDAALATVEEARLFGHDWLRALGSLPNEYLYYWYFTRDAVRSIRNGGPTRGDYLLEQQRAFYRQAGADPDAALAMWTRVRRDREETYLAEVRPADDQRSDDDLAGGGYEGVALAVMAALLRGEPATLILNVANGTTLAGLPADAVVEVPCLVDGTGAHPLATRPLEGHQLGLVQQVKAVEQLTIEAARAGDPERMVTALALHPLVDSANVARDLARGYGILPA